MKLDVRGIKREWKRSERDSVPFLFVSSTTGTDVLRTVEEAVEVANATLRRQRSDGGTDFACTEPWPAPKGASFTALIADTEQGLEDWTEAFAVVVDAGGLDGQLTAERPSYPAIFSSHVVALSAVIAVEGWRPARVHQSIPAWFIDPVLGERIFDWATDWAADGDDEMHLGLGLSMFRRPRDLVRALLPGASRRHTNPCLVNAPDLDHARYVLLDGSGRLVVQLRDTSREWLALAGDLEQVLVEFADVTEFSAIRFAHATPASNRSVVHSNWPPPGPPVDARGQSASPYYQCERHLDTEYVPDAYGLQVAGDRHLEKMQDLSRWDVTEVAPGRHLVKAEDPAAWFATETPDLDMVEQARQDFAAAILRGETPRQPDPEE
jgi:hypothetical protein